MDIITREEWGARPPRWTPKGIQLPSPELWLHHTVGIYRGAEGMRNLQRFHQTPVEDGGRGWSDVGYSFVIESGSVSEGRGPGVLGAHTGGRNAISHGICLVGNFEDTQPAQDDLDVLVDLIRFGHGEGWWPDALTGGHRDVKATRCPGENLYVQIPDINRRAGGEPTVPTSREPDPLVQEIQEIVLEAGFFLPEFGADGFLGPETVSAINAMAGELGLMKPDAMAGGLFRQAIKALLPPE